MPTAMAGGKVSRGQPDLYLIVWSLFRGYYALLTSWQSEEDTIYEQDILRDPESIKPWLGYINFKLRHGSLHEQAFVLERACLQLPRSYKLWRMVSVIIHKFFWDMLTVAVSFY
jgi:pre-mRNA-splicing factor SYF1